MPGNPLILVRRVPGTSPRLVSRTGVPFPINKAIREIQGRSFNEENAWRGNIVIAKYRGGGVDPFMSLIDISMADFPIIKNHFLHRGPTAQVCTGAVERVESPNLSFLNRIEHF